MATNHNPAQPNASLPKGTPAPAHLRGVLVAAHVNAYLAKLTPKQEAIAMQLPAAQVAASAGCALYAQQYAYRQHLRKSGTRVRGSGGHWGTAQGKVQRTANAKANKLNAAAATGAGQAKAKAQAEATATEVTATVEPTA